MGTRNQGSIIAAPARNRERVFNAPPGWPPPPPGWVPPEGWTPDPAWPPVPPGWQFWLPTSAVPTTADTGRSWPARHKGLTVLAAVLALFVTLGVIGSLTEADVSESVSSSDDATDSPTAPVDGRTPSDLAKPSGSSATVPAAPPQAIEQGQSYTAVALLGRLAVKGRAAKTGYGRDAFGPAWLDTDRNGCDTRNDILRRDLDHRSVRPGTNGCVVRSGVLLSDPYTRRPVRVVYGGTSEVDIDHVVALSDAWQKGAARWVFRKRLAFANDPLNLLAVDSGANRQKGDSDAASWLPANKPYRCAYVARQVAVKAKYRLWVTAAERVAIARVLATCPARVAPRGGVPTLSPVAASTRTRTSSQPHATATKSSTPYVHGVHPGAFCSEHGQSGYTDAGTLMRCSTTSTDSRYRWRSA